MVYILYPHPPQLCLWFIPLHSYLPGFSIAFFPTDSCLKSHRLSRRSTHTTLMIIYPCQSFVRLHFGLPTDSVACFPAFACIPNALEKLCTLYLSFFSASSPYTIIAKHNRNYRSTTITSSHQKTVTVKKPKLCLILRMRICQEPTVTLSLGLHKAYHLNTLVDILFCSKSLDGCHRPTHPRFLCLDHRSPQACQLPPTDRNDPISYTKRCFHL